MKSSPLKAAPNGLEPTSPRRDEAVASLVADSYRLVQGRWFRSGASSTTPELAKVSDGRVFTARQGVPLKLVDLIGGQREAIDWLVANKGVAKDLPVREWKKKSSLERLGLVGGRRRPRAGRRIGVARRFFGKISLRLERSGES